MARPRIVAWFKSLWARRGGSLERQRANHLAEPRWKDRVEQADAWAQMESGYEFPPNYVPPADEGRPRH